MSYRTIEVRKSTPNIGAEIHGIDLSKPLSDEQFRDVHAALMDNLVIFFRDQKLGLERHKEFGARFGKLHFHPAAPRVFPEHPEVFVIKADESSTYVAGEDWHSDVSCDAEPPMGSILYRGRYGSDDAGKVYPRAEHPVVRTHPVTGRKCLYVNRFFTTRIVGLSKIESDGLLQMLFRHVETPEFQVRFRWQPGSIAFWDNRCAQHRALWDYYPNRRYGHRVTVAGDKPF